MNMDEGLIGRWAVNLQGRLGQITGYERHYTGEVRAIGADLYGREWQAQAPTVILLSDSTRLSETLNRRLPNA